MIGRILLALMRWQHRHPAGFQALYWILLGAWILEGILILRMLRSMG